MSAVQNPLLQHILDSLTQTSSDANRSLKEFDASPRVISSLNKFSSENLEQVRQLFREVESLISLEISFRLLSDNATRSTPSEEDGNNSPVANVDLELMPRITALNLYAEEEEDLAPQTPRRSPRLKEKSQASKVTLLTPSPAQETHFQNITEMTPLTIQAEGIEMPKTLRRSPRFVEKAAAPTTPSPPQRRITPIATKAESSFEEELSAFIIPTDSKEANEDQPEIDPVEKAPRRSPRLVGKPSAKDLKQCKPETVGELKPKARSTKATVKK